MNATAEQKKELTIKALEIAGFTENSEYKGVFTQEHGMKKIVKDLNIGGKSYFLVDKKKVTEDDEHNTLAKVDKMVAEAEDGRMPTRTEPDMVYSPGGPEITPEQPDESIDQATAQYIKDTESLSDDDPAKVTEEMMCVKNTQPNVPAVPDPTQDCAPANIVHSTAPPAPFVPQGTMIKGFVPGLKEIGKIKIGRKGAMKTSQKGTEYRPPEKFDHFEVVTLYKDDFGDFIPDAPVMGLIGTDCKELDISLLYNDPTLNFFTRYNQYKGGKCMCSGDGQIATVADGKQIDCDPDTCLQFKTKKCKANGILSVVLKDAPRLGGVYKFRTTSFNSIRSILSSLFFIQSLTGGILADIPLKMTVSPQSVNPVGSPTAQTIYVVNLEYPGNMDDLHKQTIELMTRKAGMQSKIVELEAQARIAITAPETKEDIQDAEYEFYPDTVKA